MSLIRLGKLYFAEAFTLHESHGKNLCKTCITVGVRHKTGEVLGNCSLHLCFKWLFLFFITHCKTLTFEIIAGVLSQKITSCLGVFYISVRITS